MAMRPVHQSPAKSTPCVDGPEHRTTQRETFDLRHERQGPAEARLCSQPRRSITASEAHAGLVAHCYWATGLRRCPSPPPACKAVEIKGEGPGRHVGGAALGSLPPA